MASRTVSNSQVSKVTRQAHIGGTYLSFKHTIPTRSDKFGPYFIFKSWAKLCQRNRPIIPVPKTEVLTKNAESSVIF